MPQLSPKLCACVLPLLLPGLWTAEETAKVLDDIRPWLTQQEGLGEGHEAAWAAFVNRCRDNLHLILTMSPVGDAFRTRWGWRQLVGCRGGCAHGGQEIEGHRYTDSIALSA